MKPPVVVTFARPEESGAFRKKLAVLKKGRCGPMPAWRGLVGETRVTIIHTGIGPAAAESAIREVIQSEKPCKVIGGGFAGGLDPALRVGDTLVSESAAVIFSREIPLETPEQKAAAFRETGARLVDMETAVIAAACAAEGIPFVAIRAVSDSADEPLPVPFQFWFDVKRQRPRPFALVGFLLRRPSRAVPFARFVMRLPRVAEALAGAIEHSLR
jgi:adenosylhomocysteine nucleosidase